MCSRSMRTRDSLPSSATRGASPRTTILVPVVLRQWGVEDLTGLDDEAERARDALVKRIERIGKAGRRQAARLESATAGAEAEARRIPEPV